MLKIRPVLPASLRVRRRYLAVLSLVQRCVVRRIRREANGNLQAQGCTPSSWVPEGTPEVKVKLRGWGREPAGAERPVVCQTASFTPYLAGHPVDRMEPLKVKRLWYLRGPQLIVADLRLLFWFV